MAGWRKIGLSLILVYAFYLLVCRSCQSGKMGRAAVDGGVRGYTWNLAEGRV